MKFEFNVWTIQDLINLYNSQKLNLNPAYQRNDIWPPLSKKRLIESVKKGFPLPTFFLHKKANNSFDMIDGQQRTRTFLGYQKKFFPDMEKQFYKWNDDDKLYNSYKLSICLVEIENDEISNIEDFYYRVNKYGVKLNRPEIKRAGFANSRFQELIEKLSKEQSFIQLSIFSDKTLERLNDQDFVSELIVLIKDGITDKKIAVDKLYENQEGVDFEFLEKRFNEIIQIITDLDDIYPIAKTRYRQRNDFYTLFSFLLAHSNELSFEVMSYQYRILVLIDQDIYPTNDKCWAFQEYATNCVSQSNSKRSRLDRLSFFEFLLLNMEATPTQIDLEQAPEYQNLVDILDFYHLTDKDLVPIDDYFLINADKLNELKKEIKF